MAVSPARNPVLAPPCPGPRSGAFPAGTLLGLLCLIVINGAPLSVCWAQQTPPGESAEDQHSLYYGVHLPRDRPLARGLSVARQLLDDGRYAESLPVLVRVLHAPEDAYDSAGSGGAESLKSQVAQLIYSLPAEGQRAYLLEVQAQSNREFREALASGEDALARVAGRFPRTEAGRTATWILAQRAFEHGDYGDAAALLARVLQDPDVVGRQRRDSRLQLATALLANDRLAEVQEMLQETPALREGLKNVSSIEEGPEQATVNWLSSLAESLRERLSDPSRRQRLWLTAGGDSRRNPALDAPPPHLWARWSNPAIAQQEWLGLPADEALSQATSAGAASPLVVGRWVVVRHATGLSGIDSQSGKLVWETPLASGQPERPSAHQLHRLRGESSLLANYLASSQKDSVSSRTSSDGRLVFAIAATDRSKPTTRGGAWDQFRFRRSSETEAAGNQIVAVDTDAEGKLAWRTSDQAALRDTFFLDCPLAINGALYAIGEADQTISLYQLAPDTGELLWKQTLATVEDAIDEEPVRTVLGARACYADGLIVCSTGAGLVAAIDPLERASRWVYRFPVEGGVRQAPASPWGRREQDRWPLSSSKQWLRSQMLVSAGRVYVGSPESRLLHCLSLETGEALWSTSNGYPKLLCVASDDTVIVARANSLIGVNSSDGALRWTARLPDSSRPSGIGAWFQGQYLQPLSNGGALLVDAETGDVAQRLWVGPEGMLGNLAFDGQSVYSQSVAGVARFELLSSLESDPTEREQAEVAATQGKPQEAIAHLLAAYEASGKGAVDTEPLREALSRGIALDEPGGDSLAALNELYAQRPAGARLRLVRLLAANRAGDSRAVLHEVVAFCRAGVLDQLQTLADEMAVLPSRLFQVVASERLSPAEKAEARQQLASLAGRSRLAIIHEVLGRGDHGKPVQATSPSPPPRLDRRWATAQVDAAEKSRGSRVRTRTAGRPNAEPNEFHLPLQAAPGSVGEPSLRMVGTGEGELIGFNRFGEEVFRVELPRSIPERLEQLAKKNAPVAIQRGDWVYASSGEDVVAIDTSEANGAVAWSARKSLGQVEVSGDSPAAARLATAVRGAAGGDVRLVGASDHGVTVVARDFLACLDPESGVVQWVSTLLNTGGHPTADDRFVYSASLVRPGWRVSLATGERELLDTPAGEPLVVEGKLLTLLHRKEAVTTIDLYDRLAGRVVLSRQYDGNAQHSVTGGLLVVVDDSGKLEVLDAGAPRVMLSDQLSLGDEVVSVTAEQFGQRLVVGVNHKPRHVHDAAGVTPVDRNRVMTGPVQCYDLVSGESLWRRPAMVADKGLLARQPTDCPVLVFGARVRARDSTGRYDSIHLLVLDASTGRTLYSDSGPRNSQAKEYRIHFSDGPTPQVTIALDNSRVLLTALESPAPPAPPHTAAVEEVSPGSFWNVGSALGRLFGEGLQPAEEDAPPMDDDDD